MSDPLSPEKIEHIVNLFKEASYPQDISRFFDQETATAIKKAYADAYPKEAYNSVREVKDPQLTEFATTAFAEKHPDEAYTTAKQDHNKLLLKKARDALLTKHSPGNLGHLESLAQEHRDNHLLKEVGHAYLSVDAMKAYDISRKTHDENLTEAARKKLLAEHPALDVYKKAHLAADYILKNQAIDALIKKDPLTALTIAEKESDQAFREKALRAHIATLSLDEATKAKLVEMYFNSPQKIDYEEPCIILTDEDQELPIVENDDELILDESTSETLLNLGDIMTIEPEEQIVFGDDMQLDFPDPSIDP